MKKIVFTKNTEEKKNNIFPDDYYDVKNHTTFINQLYLNQSYDYCEDIQKEISRKVQGYIQQDKKKDRIDRFITVEQTYEKLVCSQLKCKYCLCDLKLLYKIKKDEQQWTLDRIDNNLAHTYDNVIVSCLKCNLKRRRMNMDKYEFTKKLKLKKSL
jgi:hypothetical protein